MKNKIIETLKRLRTDYGDNQNIIFAQDDDLDVFADELLKAINYSQCCKELNDKEELIFEEWLFINKYKKLFDFFIKDGVSFTESELMQKYNNEVMNI